MTIVYDYFGSLYMNLTNKCPCRCGGFCIRNQADGLGTADSLFLDREPSVDEVMAELEKWDPGKIQRAGILRIRGAHGAPGRPAGNSPPHQAKYGSYIRINTNGLSILIVTARLHRV
ncbi:MAG: hypothetical protein V8Q42_12070 [Anaerovoracaceae bacterium]